jgi:2-iminoacetate synthase ThiH
MLQKSKGNYHPQLPKIGDKLSDDALTLNQEQPYLVQILKQLAEKNRKNGSNTRVDLVDANYSRRCERGCTH